MDRVLCRNGLLLAGLLAVTVWRFAPVVGYGLVYEDFNGETAGANPLVRTSLNPTPSLDQADWSVDGDRDGALGLRLVHDVWASPLRSLGRFTFEATAYYFDRRPRWAHAVNLAVHLVNGLLLAGLVVPGAVSSLPVALVGLYWLHPIQAETVAYIAGGRGELLLTTGVLVALLGLRWLSGWQAAAVVVGGALWAILSKESAVGLLVLLPVAVWFFRRGTRVAGAIAVTLAGMLAGGLWLLGPILRQALHSVASPEAWAFHVFQQTAAAWRLSALLVWPGGLSIDHDFGTIPIGLAVVAFGASIALILAAWRVRQHYPAFTFIVFAVAACILPRVVLPSTEFVTEHHWTLPLAMVAIGLGHRGDT